MSAGMLTDTQIERYSRQLVLAEIGATQQRRVLDASVAVVAAEPVRLPACLYLAAAGVGHLAVAGALALMPSNPDCRVSALPLDDALSSFDVVIAASDDPAVPERFNRACVGAGTPLVLAAVHDDAACVTTFAGHRADAPCYACVRELFTAGDRPRSVFDVVAAGLIGTLLATEALKYLLGIGDPLIGRLLVYDAQRGAFRTQPLAKNPACRVCGSGRSRPE